ncbi:hypothetical protein CEV33_4715 [Brucella grignonensis]|jgi:hypothetical protein|uniref:Uncharacterized protein n=1 Tax=Brucella grignonensis TaxID=94627 RepID=A0A256G6G6_9HYPH|nr:hypothetical protein CEV33_4715 [Brucella grignonensis]
MISSSALARAQPIAAAICVLNMPVVLPFEGHDGADGRHGFPVSARINLADWSAVA